ncbi:hypothetical protein Syun_005934 [Stephania yunnanensis]|uniref:Uncharacterized protein n=1 Tax=Stephania yunnanensis TaxID=152371 RepID=A0AAP0PX33_9MAGN
MNHTYVRECRRYDPPMVPFNGCFVTQPDVRIPDVFLLNVEPNCTANPYNAACHWLSSISNNSGFPISETHQINPSKTLKNLFELKNHLFSSPFKINQNKSRSAHNIKPLKSQELSIQHPNLTNSHKPGFQSIKTESISAHNSKP